MPQIADGSSADKGDEPSMVDEDMKKSPSLPSAEFRDEDNTTGYVRVERVNGELQLKRRPHFTEHGSNIYIP